jgi:YggT family protein
MPTNVSTALIYIVNALTSLYLLVLLLRFWLPLLRADFRNPLAQGIFKLTSPLVIPLRRFIPAIGRLDTATVLVTIAFQCLAIFLVLIIVGERASASNIFLLAIVKLAMLSVNIFAYAILIRVVLSWISPGQHNPATAIIGTLTDPVLRPLRRLIPPLGGMDLTPMFAIIGLFALNILIGGFLPSNI